MNDIDSLNEMEGMDDNSFKNMVMTWLKDFRVLNKHLYSRQYICPYCNEECEREKLLDLAQCGHECCLDCWKMRANLVVDRNLAKLSCSVCDAEIPTSTVIANELLPPAILNRYLIIKMKEQPDSQVFECGKCGTLLWNKNNTNSVKCPICKNMVCARCGEYGHNTTLLNISCEEFVEYKNADEYFEFRAHMEEYRERKIREEEEEAERQKRLKKMEEEEILRRKIEDERRAREEERRLRLEAERRAREEAAANQEWLNANTKACPNCRTHIQKNGGCNHMTCRNCGYEFCWLCMERYTGVGHFRRGNPNGCVQFSN